MDKYKKTAGLNYLSENSYKGDGSPGMVMGIASDARSDTNTYEGKGVNRGPTTSSKHSTERELKKYDPAHGHTKPEGGNPQVCPSCKGEGCSSCGDTGEVISKKRNDPKVDEALEDIKRLSGLTESGFTGIEEIDLLNDPNGDRIQQEIVRTSLMKDYNIDFLPIPGDIINHSELGKVKVLKIIGLDTYGGPAEYEIENKNGKSFPITFDELTEMIGYGEISDVPQDLLTEISEDIKRLSGLSEAFAWDEIDEAKRKKRHDDDDDEEEEKPEDPDKDKVQHILMQLRKAQDVDGDHPIKFLDGSEHILPLKDINEFMQMYMNVKPQDRERLQQVAIMSKEKFDKLLTFFTPKHGKLEKSIYEDEEAGEMITEEQFDEAAGKKDACYHKVKSRYKVWPSAYASGALVKCRKVGASNWGTGGKKKKKK